MEPFCFEKLFLPMPSKLHPSTLKNSSYRSFLTSLLKLSKLFFLDPFKQPLSCSHNSLSRSLQTTPLTLSKLSLSQSLQTALLTLSKLFFFIPSNNNFSRCKTLSPSSKTVAPSLYKTLPSDRLLYPKKTSQPPLSKTLY